MRSRSARTATKSNAMQETRRASLRLNSYNAADRTFTAIAATETPVLRTDFIEGTYQSVLSMKPNAVRLQRLNSGRAPLLDSHRTGSARDQIGVIRSARVENKKLIIEGQLSSRDDLASIAADVEADVIQNVSVGLFIHDSTEAKDPRGVRVVTCTDWEPFEVSIVTVGADPEAHIRSLKGKPMPKARRRVENNDLAADELDRDQIREGDDLENDTDDVTTRGGLPAGVTRIVTTGQERALRSLAERANIDGAVITDCITRGLNETQCRSAMLDILASRSDRTAVDPTNIAIHGSAQAPTDLEDAISAAMYGRMTGKAQEGRAQEFMGRSLLEMGAALLEHRGERVSWRSRDRLAAQIMTQSAGHTTSDFPNLLASAGNRVLMDAYQAVQTPLKLIARRRDAADFRALSMLRLGEAPKLLEVTQSGEVKHGTRAEAKEGFSLKTFARIFGLSRQAIINDDLQAFADVNTAWGRAAADTEADQLVALLTANSGSGATMEDTKALYHTDHGNKAASGTVIDVTNLGLARKALREMKGLDGVTPISATPKHLLVGAAKETEAEKVLAELAAAAVSEANPFSGKLTLHVEPRLTGNAWRLFADPAAAPVLNIAYLNGQAGPIMETKDGWDVLGAEFRCILDFGCGVSDYRGTYLNTGA